MDWCGIRSIFSISQEESALATLNLGTDDEPRIFGEKNARKVIEAIARAKDLPLARWLHALAIPEVGETTAHDLAQFHDSLDEVAQSPLLRDVLELERLRAEVDATKPGRGKKTGEPELLLGDDSAAVRHSAAQAALEQTVERLRKAGFGQVTRKKDGSGFVTKAGPVLARAVLDYSPQTGEAVLKRLQELKIHPKGS